MAKTLDVFILHINLRLVVFCGKFLFSGWLDGIFKIIYTATRTLKNAKERTVRKKILFILIAILLTCFPIIGCAAEGKADNVGLQKGNIAPDFSLYDLDGKAAKLSDFRGQVVMLNFWATWCTACQGEMPSMEAIYRRYKDKGFVILAIDVKDNQDKVKKFMKEKNLSFLVLLDWNEAICEKYDILYFPTTFIIDQNGIIRAVVVGERNWEEPQNSKLITDLLSK